LNSGVRGYPRPQLRRRAWTNLDGSWEFAIDRDARWHHPAEVSWDRTILVPFAPEAPASGIGDTSLFRACWYRRAVDVPPPGPDERLLVRFGAVDYHATIWLDGRRIGEHEGGYTPFAVDATEPLRTVGPHELAVCAHDDPGDLAKPRGKQDWLREPHSIWYPRTSGIWQTVWLERLPATAIARLRWTPLLEHWEIGFEAEIDGDATDGLRLRVRLGVGDLQLADDTYTVIAQEVVRGIAFSDPGIDDFRNEILWSPTAPTLIDAKVELLDAGGAVIDRVESYTALRRVGTQGDRFVLNGRPLQLRMVLDQGYWPETGATAPDDSALRRDVELVKAMGFNGVRKHQKIEDPRYLYWADRLGLLVWGEMPSAYRFTTTSIERLTAQWIEAIQRDYSHPCIAAWVPFNESWGVPNLPDMPAERHFVQAIYHLTRTLDPSRPVVGNDGWESVATDIIGIHDYDENPAVLAARYHTDLQLPRMFRRERPGGRQLTLAGHEHAGQPIVLSEFGGVAYADASRRTWGYSRVDSREELKARYDALLKVVQSTSMFAGFCYTQFTDTYQEANGLLYADRTPKMPIDDIARATRLGRTEREKQLEEEWRARMQRFRVDHGLAQG
jgi:beta-galactosidase/beta-glucuronidase